MRASMTNKFTSIRKWTHLPLALLLLALSTVFLFGGDRDRFYRTGINNTANYITVAMNLSPEHNFVGYYYRTLNEDGEPTYFPFNRFPPGAYALIKLAMMPFGDDLGASLYAARLLMLTFFAAAALFAYFALSRLAANRWIALIATLLAFASYFGLYYNDMVASDGMPDLFVVMLTFHGMVIFEQEGRFRQLLVKACLALLIGWHVYALLLPFIVLGFGCELIRLIGASPSARSAHPYLALLRSRYVMLGCVSLLVGVAVLIFNFTNEYIALNGETPLTELRSFQSALRRTGLGLSHTYDSGILEWQAFLKEQLYRAGLASAPYALAEYGGLLIRLDRTAWALLGAVMGGGAIGALLIDLRFTRREALFATLALFGLCWALLARQQITVHHYEGMYYIGIPLAFFALVLLFMRKRLGNGPIVGMAVAAVAIFGLSGYQMSFVGNDVEASEIQDAAFSDFQAIRDNMPQDKIVYVPIRPTWKADTVFAGTPRASIYYLSGRIIAHSNNPEHCRLADFIITAQREEGAALLTPNNRLRFLYERSPELIHITHIPEICQWKDERGH